MKKKFVVLILSVILLLTALFLANKNTLAASNNPIFATIVYVDGKIQEVMNTLNNYIESNQSDIDLLKERASSLEEENNLLKNKISELEGKSLPDGKWVHVCFDVATANLFVMKGGTCFPHVHWKIFVQCYPGTPCVPDNPNDTYYIPPQEQ